MGGSMGMRSGESSRGSTTTAALPDGGANRRVARRVSRRPMLLSMPLPPPPPPSRSPRARKSGCGGRRGSWRDRRAPRRPLPVSPRRAGVRVPLFPLRVPLPARPFPPDDAPPTTTTATLVGADSADGTTTTTGGMAGGGGGSIGSAGVTSTATSRDPARGSPSPYARAGGPAGGPPGLMHLRIALVGTVVGRGRAQQQIGVRDSHCNVTTLRSAPLSPPPLSSCSSFIVPCVRL